MKRLLSMVVLLLLMVGIVGCDTQEKTEASPYDETAYPAEVLEKINPELLAAIEWEAEHPGKGHEVAPDLALTGRGTVYCRVYLNPDKIKVVGFIEPGTPPPNDQPAIQLVMDYGGQPLAANDITNSVYCILPLDRIKDLAGEESVFSIVASGDARERPVP